MTTTGNEQFWHSFFWGRWISNLKLVVVNNAMCSSQLLLSLDMKYLSTEKSITTYYQQPWHYLVFMYILIMDHLKVIFCFLKATILIRIFRAIGFLEFWIEYYYWNSSSTRRWLRVYFTIQSNFPVSVDMVWCACAIYVSSMYTFKKFVQMPKCCTVAFLVTKEARLVTPLDSCWF